LVQAAHAAARKRGSYLKALYHLIAARRGAKRAVVAVARTILQIAYRTSWWRARMVLNPTPCNVPRPCAAAVT